MNSPDPNGPPWPRELETLLRDLEPCDWRDPDPGVRDRYETRVDKILAIGAPGRDRTGDMHQLGCCAALLWLIRHRDLIPAKYRGPFQDTVEQWEGAQGLDGLSHALVESLWDMVGPYSGRAAP